MSYLSITFGAFPTFGKRSRDAASTFSLSRTFRVFRGQNFSSSRLRRRRRPTQHPFNPVYPACQAIALSDGWSKILCVPALNLKPKQGAGVSKQKLRAVATEAGIPFARAIGIQLDRFSHRWTFLRFFTIFVGSGLYWVRLRGRRPGFPSASEHGRA